MLRSKDNIESRLIELNDFKIGFEFELDYLKKYVERLARPVHDLLESLESEIASNLDSNPEIAEQINESYFAEAAKIKSYFYNSLIVLTYSLYESSLQKICESIKFQTRSKLCYTHLKNTNLSENSLLFIKLLSGVCGKSNNGIYSRLVEFQKLRNKIAHKNSQVKGSTPEEIRTQLDNLDSSFNRGLLDGNDKNLIFNFGTGDFAINSASLIHEFIGLVENNVLYIYEQLKEIEFSIEQGT